MKEHQFQI